MKKYSKPSIQFLDHKFFIAALCLFLLLIAISPLAAQDPSQDEAALVMAAHQAVTLKYAGLPPGPLGEPHFTLGDGYAYGVVPVRALEGVHAGVDLIHFMAQRSPNGTWEVALEFTPEFNQLTALNPSNLMPSALQSTFISADLGLPMAGNNEVGLSWPFATGETWSFNGPHDGPGVDQPRPALDLALNWNNPPVGKVRAAADGIVVRYQNCGNYVEVHHGNSWETSYYHLENIVVSNNQQVTRGTILGDEGNGVGCGGFSSAAHVHFAVLHNGNNQFIHGWDIGGYTVEAGARAYEGCLYRIRDNAKFCNNAPLLNEGAIGTGSPNATDFWLFSSSMAGWTTNAALSPNGFTSPQQSPRWNIIGANPSLTSPAINFTAANYRYLFVEMATTGNACANLYFRRVGDANWDEARKFSFTPIADGAARKYAVDTQSNTLWNGTINALRLDPVCNGASGSLTLRSVTVSGLIPANTELITNPNFSSNFSGWGIGQDCWFYTFSGSNPINIARCGSSLGFLAIFQDRRAVAPSGTPFQASMRLGNSSGSSRQVVLRVRDVDNLTDSLTCPITLPPNTPIQTYGIQGKSNTNWRNVRFELEIITTSNNADIQIASASLQRRPELAGLTQTVCYQGTAPTPPPLPVDTLATFNSNTGQASLLNTLSDQPASGAYNNFTPGAPINGQWVMGDWDGNGTDTPAVFANGAVYLTNTLGATANWSAHWIGPNGTLVAGRFNPALNRDCLGVVEQATLGQFTVFVLYYACDFTTNTPAVTWHWMSAALYDPSLPGLAGAWQFAIGDWNNDGAETPAIRRGPYVAFSNVPIVDANFNGSPPFSPNNTGAEFAFAQNFGAPYGAEYGQFVTGDWNGNGAATFGLFYPSINYFYYSNVTTWETGTLSLQRITNAIGNPRNVVSWRPVGGSLTAEIEQPLQALDDIETELESLEPLELESQELQPLD